MFVHKVKRVSKNRWNETYHEKVWEWTEAPQISANGRAYAGTNPIAQWAPILFGLVILAILLS